MAESVQFRLEAMVPALEDLAKKKLFGPEEIREIVSRRTRFEYKLKRRIAVLQDFLSYIEYEKELEALRRRRKHARGVPSKHSLSDSAGVRQIHSIYKRAVRKFKGDLALWRQYLAFARANDGRRILGKLYTNVLQLHPLCEDLWIGAADWEWHDNGNMVTARALMQRALRFIPNSETIWLAYFRLELDYVKRLDERQKTLGIKSTTGPAVDDVTLPSNSIELPDASSAILAVPRAVYLHSLGSLRDDFPLHKRFLAIAYEYGDVAASLRQTIYATMASSFAAFPACQAFLARRHLRDMRPADPGFTEALRQAALDLNKAFEDLPTSEMLAESVTFFTELLGANDLEPEVASVLRDRLHQLFQFAATQELLTEEMCWAWLNFESIGDWPSTLVEQAVASFPKSGRILSWQARRLLNKKPASEELLSQVLPLLETIEAGIPGLSSLWDCFVGSLLESLSEKSLKKVLVPIISRNVASIGSVLSELLLKVCARYGTTAMRDICSSILDERAIGQQLYPAWIAAELESLPQDSLYLRRLYAQAVQCEPTSEKMWLGAIRLDIVNRQFQPAAALYERALRAVANSEYFMHLYDVMKQQL